jgi:hypothetical protein
MGSMYFTPIPPEVIERLPMVLANHSGAAFDVRIQAFGDDGEQGFSIDVYTDANTVTPADRRQKPHTQAKQTTYFFDADGGFDGEPQTSIMRYR